MSAGIAIFLSFENEIVGKYIKVLSAFFATSFVVYFFLPILMIFFIAVIMG